MSEKERPEKRKGQTGGVDLTNKESPFDQGIPKSIEVKIPPGKRYLVRTDDGDLLESDSPDGPWTPVPPALQGKWHLAGISALWRLRDEKAAESPRHGTGGRPHAADAQRNGHAPNAAEPGGRAGDLAGMTVAEAARVILKERGHEAMHYGALAEEMQRRGYKSGRSTPFRATSVATILTGKPDQFEKVGAGRFRLKET